jgi:hypothetical protein
VLQQLFANPGFRESLLATPLCIERHETADKINRAEKLNQDDVCLRELKRLVCAMHG